MASAGFEGGQGGEASPPFGSSNAPFTASSRTGTRMRSPSAGRLRLAVSRPRSDTLQRFERRYTRDSVSYRNRYGGGWSGPAEGWKAWHMRRAAAVSRAFGGIDEPAAGC